LVQQKEKEAKKGKESEERRRKRHKERRMRVCQRLSPCGFSFHEIFFQYNVMHISRRWVQENWTLFLFSKLEKQR
jgi:hypothetical protein